MPIQRRSLGALRHSYYLPDDHFRPAVTPRARGGGSPSRAALEQQAEQPKVCDVEKLSHGREPRGAPAGLCVHVEKLSAA